MVVTLLTVVGALTLCHAPFIWWYVLAGARVVALPTEADTILLTSDKDEALVEVADEEIDVEIEVPA